MIQTFLTSNQMRGNKKTFSSLFKKQTKIYSFVSDVL